MKTNNTSILSNKKILEKVVKESFSISEVLRAFNLSPKGSAKTIAKYLKEFKICTMHFNPKNYLLTKSFEKLSEEEVFCIDSKISSKTVKNRILKYNLIEYKCHGKGCTINGDWLGNKITLQLEHINGINTDNRIENLTFLCPNCHSQTTTFGGKNIKSKIIKPVKHIAIIHVINNDLTNILDNIHLYKTFEECLNSYKIKTTKSTVEKLKNTLIPYQNHKNVKAFYANNEISKKRVLFPSPQKVLEMVNDTNYSQTAKVLGCSDNGVRKYLKRNGLI